jgi:nucleotide-binding universal stress UspA family protein
MAKKILVPTDGSERAEKAAAYAIGLAKELGASLRFVSVVDDYAPAFAYDMESGLSIDINEVVEKRDRYVRESVDRLVEQAAAAGVEAEGQVVEGHAWEEILAEVDRAGADQIVMGSHGRRALAAAVLGNVTFNVIHHAKVPVTVIPVHD